VSAFFPQFGDAFRALLDELSGSRIAVIGHGRPDGDCIGSQIGLTGILRASGVEACAVNADPVPRALRFLERGSIRIEGTEVISEDGEPLLYVDCADEFRVGPETAGLLASREKLANIDHHISNTKFGHANFVDADAAATCEILAGLAYDLDIPLNEQLAQALYVGMLTDTGRFGYAATSRRVFEICALLVEDGASPEIAHRELFENEPIRRLKLLERFLGSLTLELGGRVCVGTLMRNDFSETGTSYEDTEGFVDYARAVDVAKVGMLIEERESTSKCSLRADDAVIRVDRIAGQFGGGGHSRAAAMNTEISIDDLKTGLLKALNERFEEIGL